jgi:hypothetical protein
MRAAVPPISFATEYGDEFHHESAYVPRWDVGVDISPVLRIEDKVTKTSIQDVGALFGLRIHLG